MIQNAPMYSTNLYSETYDVSADTIADGIFPPIIYYSGSTMAYQCFRYADVREAYLPNVTEIPQSQFAQARILTSIHLSAVTSIGASAFYNCRNLTNVDLRSVNAVPTLGTNAFSYTPITSYVVSYGASTMGNIYVKSSLLSAFKAATNWATLSSRFIGV